jgi:hypothetical protein
MDHVTTVVVSVVAAAIPATGTVSAVFIGATSKDTARRERGEYARVRISNVAPLRP